MSTKIYEAYQWKGSLPELYDKLVGMRERIFEKAVQRCLSSGSLDQLASVGMYSYSDLLQKAIRSQSWDIYDEKSKLGVENFQSSAVIYLYNHKIYVQFFGLSRDFRFSKQGLADFHYQNQTDRPEEVSETQWKQREKIWDKILKKDGRPSHSGLTFPFIEDSDCIRIALEMFTRMHGHKPWPNTSVQCALCDKLRTKDADVTSTK